MRNYNYEKIDKILQPVMDMMREEFPNDCKLIVGADFSQIVFEHTYLTFLSEEMKKPIFETTTAQDLAETLTNYFERELNKSTEKSHDPTPSD